MNHTIEKPLAPAWPIRGARVEGDQVIVTVKGGNDAARWLCGEMVALIGGPQARAALSAPPGWQAINLNIIRKWPDGFGARLQHVWLDVVGFIPEVKLGDLQRTLAEFGFTMVVYAAPSPQEPTP